MCTKITCKLPFNKMITSYFPDIFVIYLYIEYILISNVDIKHELNYLDEEDILMSSNENEIL